MATWYSNSHLRSRGSTENNLAEGKWIYYYPEGARRAEGICHMGAPIGKWETYPHHPTANFRPASQEEEQIQLCNINDIYGWNGVEPVPPSNATANTTAHVDSTLKMESDDGPIHQTGYLAFSAMPASFQYNVTSPLNNFQAQSSAISTTLNLSGEHFFGASEKWGISASAEENLLVIDRTNFQQFSFEGMAKARYWIGARNDGWEIIPKVGLALRQYLEITPIPGADLNNGPFQSLTITAYGGSVGLEVRKKLSEKWSFSFSAKYFIPALISGAPAGSAITSAGSCDNLSAQAQMLFWFARRWGIAGGAQFDLRSISFDNGLPSSDVIQTEGLSAFASVVFRLGSSESNEMGSKAMR